MLCQITNNQADKPGHAGPSNESTVPSPANMSEEGYISRCVALRGAHVLSLKCRKTQFITYRVREMVTPFAGPGCFSKQQRLRVSFHGICKGHRVMHANTCAHTPIKLISAGLLFQASSTFKDDRGCRRGQLRRWMRLRSGMPRCEC